MMISNHIPCGFLMVEELDSGQQSRSDQLSLQKGCLGELAFTCNQNRLPTSTPHLPPHGRAALLSLESREAKNGRVVRTGCWERETPRGWTFTHHVCLPSQGRQQKRGQKLSSQVFHSSTSWMFLLHGSRQKGKKEE